MRPVMAINYRHHQSASLERCCPCHVGSVLLFPDTLRALGRFARLLVKTRYTSLNIGITTPPVFARYIWELEVCREWQK